MRQKLSSISQSLRLPSICVLCNQFHKSSYAVCSNCIEFIVPIGESCCYCAQPLYDTSYLVCGQCIKSPPHFDGAVIAYRFEEPLRSLLHQFKYHNGLYLTSFLGQLMLNAWHLKPRGSPCFIPVPMHPQRLKLRGFNQAAVLTRYLARTLKAPFDLSSCQKIINTAPQASLDGEARQKNLRHAFQAKPIAYSHVVLIDDLLTTGNTANALAYVLKKAGVERVDIWCCARTVIKE